MNFAVLILLITAAGADPDIVIKRKSQQVIETTFQDVCDVTGYVMKGIQWKSCKEGKNEVMGCKSPEGKRYEFNDEFVDSTAKWRCVKRGDTVILEPIACVLKGQVVDIGRIQVSGRFFYKCMMNDKGLGLVIFGCMDRKQALVSIGETFKKDKFLFLCEREGQKVYERALGCYIGKQFVEADEMSQSGEYFVQCKARSKSSLKIEVVGCADEQGTLLGDGDTFHRGMVVYRCEEGKEKPKFQVVAIGCLAKDHRTPDYGLQEFKFGDRWYESYKETSGYMMECQLFEGRVGPKIVECVFHRDGIKKMLKVGCGAQLDDKNAVICKAVDGKSVVAKRKTIHKGQSVSDVVSAEGVELC